MTSPDPAMVALEKRVAELEAQMLQLSMVVRSLSQRAQRGQA